MLNAHTRVKHIMCLQCLWRLAHIARMEEDMGDEKRTVRVPLLLTPEEAKELDDWQFTNRLRTRSDALREMMRRTIEQSSTAKKHST